MKPIGVLAAACIALGVLACRSSNTGSSRAALVKAEALPQELRAVWDAYHRGGAAWEAERERVRADPELARFLVDNCVIEMVRAYDRSALATAGRAPGLFERAQAELVLHADRSTPVLVELLEKGDGIVAFLAADTLVRIGVPAVVPTAEKLASKTGDVRRRAAELLARLPADPEHEPHVLERLGTCAEKDAEWIVRAQAALALGARGRAHAHKGYALAVLSRALGDGDSAVASSACDALATLGEPRAIPALQRALERSGRDGDLKLRAAAKGALAALAPQRAH